MLNIPVVIAAYNRTGALERLLVSLNKAIYPRDILLIISIDGGAGNREVVDLANRFEWGHGEKQVITAEKNMGLRSHILKCGKLTKDYDGIVLLEDDLYVSPHFYTYVIQAHNAYREDKHIAGIALYSHQYNETATLPFKPVDDGYDVYFMQIACSWGQSWLKHQWELFEAWYAANHEIDLSNDSGVPPDVRLWPATSWKKYYLKYIIQSHKYFVYPRISLTTNFADPGVNHLGTSIHQVPLLYSAKDYRFPESGNSIAKYDAYCEMKPNALMQLAEGLEGLDLEIDLYGMKNKAEITSEYVITTQEINESIKYYARKLKPHELNVTENISGNEIRLGLTKDMSDYGQFIIHRNRVNQDYKSTHDYFYQITKDHYRPSAPQKQIAMYKRIIRKMLNILGVRRG